MWGEVAVLLATLAVAVGLSFLVTRRAARAWAVWLLVCLMAASLAGLGGAPVGRPGPEGPPDARASRGDAAAAFVFGCVVLLLVLRADAGEPSPAPSGGRPARAAGLSVLLFGLAVLVATLTEAIY